MKTKNKFTTESGIDYDFKTGTWDRNKHLEFDLPDDDSAIGYGHSITPSAFRKMISDKLIQLRNVFMKQEKDKTNENLLAFLNSQKCAVEFGKERLLRILSQKDCIGLRFTFCLNDRNEESIIVSGLAEEEFNEDVGGKTTTTRRTHILQREVYRRENLDKRQAIMPFDDEKGVGKSYGDFVRETEITLDDLMNEKTETLPRFIDGVLGLR